MVKYYALGFIVLVGCDDSSLRGRVSDLEAELAQTRQALEASLAALQSQANANSQAITDAASVLQMAPYVTVSDPNIILESVNLVVRDGTGDTDGTPNGLGNVVVGYDEPHADPLLGKTGSHNVIVGKGHSYTSYGALVAGQGNSAEDVACFAVGKDNVCAAQYGSISGGTDNEVRGTTPNFARGATVSGGSGNTANDVVATVSGGTGNTATSVGATVSGGSGNTASGGNSAVCGGGNAEASGILSSVSGGINGIASGTYSVVSGGLDNSATSNGAHVP